MHEQYCTAEYVVCHVNRYTAGDLAVLLAGAGAFLLFIVIAFGLIAWVGDR